MVGLQAPPQTFRYRDVRRTPLPAKALTVNGQESVSIPLVGAVTRLRLKFDINYDVAAGPSENEDSVGRLVTQVVLVDGARVNYYANSDGRMLQYMSNFLTGRLSEWPSQPLGSTVANGQTTTVYGVIDFQDAPSGRGASSPQIEAGIPTLIQKLNTLDLTVTLGPSANVGTGYTINSVTLTVIPEIVLEGTPTYDAIVGPNARVEGVQLAKPVYRAYTVSPSQSVYAALGYEDDLPQGFLLSKSLLIVLDHASGNRSLSDLTEIAYSDVKSGQEPWQGDTTDLQQQLQSQYFGNGITYPDGVYLIDWDSVVGDGGLDRVNRLATWDALKYTIASQVDILEFHKGYSVWPS